MIDTVLSRLPPRPHPDHTPAPSTVHRHRRNESPYRTAVPHRRTAPPYRTAVPHLRTKKTLKISFAQHPTTAAKHSSQSDPGAQVFFSTTRGGWSRRALVARGVKAAGMEAMVFTVAAYQSGGDLFAGPSARRVDRRIGHKRFVNKSGVCA